MEIPVYLFTGFLESGKTKFINETLADENFYLPNDKTLVLQFEEGEEELDPSVFASDRVYIETLTEKAKLNPDKLSALARKYSATRVLIEYNGMWQLPELFTAMPDNWIIYQELMFADQSTFEVFNANMRSLVVDKLTTCELVVFNRCDENTDKTALHKIVRGVSRRCNIIYESSDGSFVYDEIEDPLPFDINAPVIEIGDRDYALWYRDLSENMPAYDGKTVSFLGQVTKNEKVPKDGFVIGRQIMTCCADDITYSGLFCESVKGKNPEKGEWVRVTAKVAVKECKLYGKTGPVLAVTSVEKADEPDEVVTTFY